MTSNLPDTLTELEGLKNKCECVTIGSGCVYCDCFEQKLINNNPLIIEALREAIEVIEYTNRFKEIPYTSAIYDRSGEFLKKYGLTDSEGG